MVEVVPDHLVDQYGIVDVKHSPNEGESIVMQGIIPVGTAPIFQYWSLCFTSKLCN